MLLQKVNAMEGTILLSQQLQVFLQAADCGSFSKAAKQLLVTPASVMKHMNTLENRLGVTLFRRTNKGIELTAAGKSLYRDGKKLLESAENAVARAKMQSFQRES